MKILPTVIVSAGLLAATVVFGLSVRPANAVGEEKWCAVTDQGGGNPVWDCEYETFEDCMPAITAGSRGYCIQNPTWRPNPSTQH